MEYKTIERPYLIQRGTIRDIKETEIYGLDSLISYDYMGSAEFEWGALPNSLKRMTASWTNYECVQVPDINSPDKNIMDADGNILYVICNKDQKDEIIIAINEFASKKYNNTKEFVGLHDYITCKQRLKVNFWWDINNDWMCCFSEGLARKLVIAINMVCVKHSQSVNTSIVAMSDRIICLYSNIKFVDEYRKSQITIYNSDPEFPMKEKIIINKRRILSVDDSDPNVLKINVSTPKSKTSRTIDLNLQMSIKRRTIYNMLKEWPLINKSKEWSINNT